MCEPTTLAFAGLALATKVGSELAERSATRKERRQTIASANEAYESTIGDLNARILEERQAAALQYDETGVQTSAAVGSAMASSAAAGIQGRSVDLLIQDLLKEQADYRVSVDRNLAATERQIGRSKEAADVQRRNQIRGAPSYNPFLGGLRVASTAAQLGIGYAARTPTGGS